MQCQYVGHVASSTYRVGGKGLRCVLLPAGGKHSAIDNSAQFYAFQIHVDGSIIHQQKKHYLTALISQLLDL